MTETPRPIGHLSFEGSLSQLRLKLDQLIAEHGGDAEVREIECGWSGDYYDQTHCDRTFFELEVWSPDD